MFRHPLPAVIVVLGVLSGAVSIACAASPVALKPVKVDLPDSDRMFQGSGADAINNNCLACHSAGMVLNQPALSRQAWTAEVNKMMAAYKAPVAPEDVGAIVDYLVRIKGAN
jgi:cytochrome c553